MVYNLPWHSWQQPYEVDIYLRDWLGLGDCHRGLRFLLGPQVQLRHVLELLGPAAEGDGTENSAHVSSEGARG